MDPVTGRFESEDPKKRGGNWYIYTSNNPVRFVDANGEDVTYAQIKPIVMGMIGLWAMAADNPALQTLLNAWLASMGAEILGFLALRAGVDIGALLAVMGLSGAIAGFSFPWAADDFTISGKVRQFWAGYAIMLGLTMDILDLEYQNLP